MNAARSGATSRSFLHESVDRLFGDRTRDEGVAELVADRG